MSFGGISLKYCSSFSPFNFITQKASFETSRFIRNQTYRFFHSCIFPLPHIVISEIGINFSITDLVRTKFMLYQFPIFWYIVSMEISITLKITFNQTSIFSKNLCKFHIHQIKERLVRRQLKLPGMVHFILTFPIQSKRSRCD